MPNTIIKRITVALNMPTVISELLIKAKAINKAMLNNSYFPNSAARLATLNTHIATLETAEIACSTTPPTGTVEARNAAAELVKADLRALKNDVQTIADADQANAMAIITSASMNVKKEASHSRKQNVAENDTDDGSVILYGEGPGAHEWRLSTDEKNWNSLPASLTATTTVSELVSGTLYYFQSRRMLANNQKTE